jgi:hypothetical protein
MNAPCGVLMHGSVAGPLLSFGPCGCGPEVRKFFRKNKAVFFNFYFSWAKKRKQTKKNLRGKGGGVGR